VVRLRLWLATAFALGAIVGSVLRAQVSDEETGKGEQSVKKRHNAHSFSPAPEKSPSPIAKAKPVSSKSKKETDTSPGPEKSPSPIAKAAKKSGEEETVPKSKPSEMPEPTAASAKPKKSPSATPKARAGKKKSNQKKKKKASPTPKKPAKGEAKAPGGTSETPKPEKSPRPVPEETRVPSENPTPPPPHAIAAPTPTPSPQTKVPRAVSADDRAQVVIEKSGFEEDQGLEPPPTPPPRRFGFWPWSRSRSSESYRYLTRSVIEQIRRAPVQRRRWQFIVVHNSGTRQGNARAFDYYHRHVRRMQNGLAYHFVIGNGTSTGNGQVEVGDRWRRQINGGHVHSDYLNNISLGICLVGDFNRDQPTRAQLESCEELIRYLRQRCGKTAGHDIVVRPHREMNPPRWPTDCPGDVFPYSWFRRF
jgi:N-acetylmuramoyl-L-alanine amidase-like protein